MPQVGRNFSPRADGASARFGRNAALAAGTPLRQAPAHSPLTPMPLASLDPSACTYLAAACHTHLSMPLQRRPAPSHPLSAGPGCRPPGWLPRPCTAPRPRALEAPLPRAGRAGGSLRQGSQAQRWSVDHGLPGIGAAQGSTQPCMPGLSPAKRSSWLSAHLPGCNWHTPAVCGQTQLAC